MSRSAIALIVFSFCAVYALAGEPAAEPLQPSDSAPPNQTTDANRAKEIRDKLRKRVTLEQGIDNSALKDVVEFISDRCDVPIQVNTQACQAEGIDGEEDV